MKLTGVFIRGNVHLSRETIKEILKKDFNVPMGSTESVEGYESVKRYIKDLIYRLDHIEI